MRGRGRIGVIDEKKREERKDMGRNEAAVDLGEERQQSWKCMKEP